MNAIANMTNALTQAPSADRTVAADIEARSRTARLRDALAAEGPMRARELARVCELRSTALVGALLKHDIANGQVRYSDGIYFFNESFAPSGGLRQRITWIPVGEQLPDADTTVLVAARACSEPVWLGYYGDGQWFDVDASRIQVTHWAHMPNSPNPS